MNRNKAMENEKELLAKVAQKNKKAFEELYKLLSQKVFYFLYRLLQSKESAEDVLMEVFSTVWNTAGKFKGNSKVATWIFGIARNLALNEMRKNKKHQGEELYETIQDKKSNREHRAFESSTQVQKALSLLSFKHREILDLVFFHEATYLEISQILEIPENTVKTRVFYAKAALKEQILEMEG